MLPRVQRLKLSVSFSGFYANKILVSSTINHLMHFGLITVDADSYESFVMSHYPFWIIHNFAPNISPHIWYLTKVTSNETSLSLLRSVIAEYFYSYVHLGKNKNRAEFTRNLSIHPVVLSQYNYKKIKVPSIRWLKRWKEIALRISEVVVKEKVTSKR